jgi:hypothetical protein
MRRLTMPPYRVAFILAPHRSGSTLLDNLLGGHSEVVTLGEPHNLRAYALQDRRLFDPKQPLICSCGSTVPACSFWQRVQDALGSPLGDLSLKWPRTVYERRALPLLQRKALSAGMAVLRQRPALFRSASIQRLLGAESIIDDNWRLFDAVHAITGAACIVDASKAAYRFRALWRRNPEAARAIVLCRDYRAVAHSLMRRGLSVEDAIAQWCRSVGQIEEMVIGIPDRHVCRVTYEALCADPQGTIKGVLHFLQLSGTSNVLKRSIADLHHISGSPSKFDPARQTIQFDDSYLSVFDERQLQYLRHAAQPLAHRWGYD